METMNISKSVDGKPPNEVGIGLKSLPRALYCGVLELLPPAWITIILLGREFIISGFRLVAAGKGTVIAAGISGKIKTVVQMVALSVLLFDDPILKWAGIPLGMILLYISAALSIWSCAEYIIKNKQTLSQLK